jgi:hypothetical protein
MLMPMHAKDVSPIGRRDAEYIEGALAAVVLLSFFGLTFGAAALDTARLIANLLLPAAAGNG